MFVASRFDVAEAHESLAIQSQNRFAFAHLRSHIVVSSLGNTSSTLACSLANGLYNCIDILFVLGISYKHAYVFRLYIFHYSNVSLYI